MGLSSTLFTNQVRKVTKDAELCSTHRSFSGHLGSGHTLQIPSLLPDGVFALAWSSYLHSYLGLLDWVQVRAQRVARLKATESTTQKFQLLQQQQQQCSSMTTSSSSMKHMPTHMTAPSNSPATAPTTVITHLPARSESRVSRQLQGHTLKKQCETCLRQQNLACS